LRSFVDEPHSAIDGPGQGEIVNLTDRRAAASRDLQTQLLSSLGPNRIAHKWAVLQDCNAKLAPAQPQLPHLSMPEHHEVRSGDVLVRRLQASLAAAADRGRPISPSFC
jgi:uncharacterized protein